MKGPWCALLSVGLLVGCSNAGLDAQQQAAAEKALSVEEILNRDPTQSDYVDAPRCINTTRIRDMQVIDEQHIVLRVARNEYYLVRFDHRCPGLRRGRPVIYEPGSGSQLCVMDGIRATYDSGLGGISPGMRCSIPGFESVTKEQVALLKDTLQSKRRGSEPVAPAPQPDADPQADVEPDEET
ncbi:MAG: DUF6491 family protein [bacterium]